MARGKPLEIDVDQNQEKSKVSEIAFITIVGLASIIMGFSTTLAMAKKRDPTMFSKGLFPSLHQTKPGDRPWSENAEPIQSGGQLAMRALGRGTLYAFTGFGVFTYGIWKLIGARDLQEFRIKVGGFLPVIPKNNPPQGKTEFESLTDLLQYVIDEDERIKKEKKT